MKNNTVGSRLRNVRETLNKTRGDFSKDFNVGLSTIIRYETDERLPSVEYLMAIHEKYGININWILLGDTSAEDKEELVEAKPILLDLNQLDFLDTLLIEKIVTMSIKTKEHLLYFLMEYEKAP